VKGLFIAIFSVLVVALCAEPAGARGPVRVGGNVIIGVPVGEFSDNVDHIGSGLSGYVTLGIPGVPFHVGGSGGYMTLGRETIGEIRIGPYVADVVTQNNVIVGHLLLRAQQKGSGFRPFMDLLVGFERIYTTTEIRVGFNVPNIDLDRGDWAVSYGVGSGAEFEVYRSTGREAEGGTDYGVSVDLGARYLIGGRADYVDIDSMILIDDQIRFRSDSSRTDMVTVHIGVSFLF
jgi:hypothetical protein